MIREIISIDEELCNGCGECVPGCPEGALRIIDGKARLVGDLLCDGLGACVGNCPTGALTVESREAEPYDEARVMQSMVTMGPNTIVAHLEHLRDHGEMEYLQTARAVIEREEFVGREMVLSRLSGLTAQPRPSGHGHAGVSSCPGSVSRSFAEREDVAAQRLQSTPAASELTHFPVQMHLLNPSAPYFVGCDFVLAADCTAFSFGAFHADLLRGKKLGIACPKLDSDQEVYVEKVRALIDDAKVNTLTVVIMQVPCCGGLLRLVQLAAANSSRKVPVKCIVVGVEGSILDEQWVQV